MSEIEIVKATTMCLAITDIIILLDDESEYELSEKDSFFFTVRKKTRNRSVVILKKTSQGIELQNQNLIIYFYPEDTAGLDCVAYDFVCKVDIQSEGTHVYTLIEGNVLIKPTVTGIEEMRGVKDG